MAEVAEPTGWTPAPWHATIEKTASFGPIGRWIVTGRTNFYRFLVAECRTHHGTERATRESVANAHLIAAAPTLYKALDQLVTALDEPRIQEKHPEVCSALRGAVVALAIARDEIPF